MGKAKHIAAQGSRLEPGKGYVVVYLQVLVCFLDKRTAQIVLFNLGQGVGRPGKAELGCRGWRWNGVKTLVVLASNFR